MDHQENNNLGNVVDFKDKLKERLEKLEQKELLDSYFIRNTECYNKAKEKGYCDCVVCQQKLYMARYILVTLNDMSLDYMKETKNNMFYGDILDVLLTAQSLLGDYIKIDPNT